MKAVLGLLFLLSGFTVAWMVLAGKLPNPSATIITPPSQSDLNGTNNNPTAGIIKGSNVHGGGPMGMKVGANANDMYASQGMMS